LHELRAEAAHEVGGIGTELFAVGKIDDETEIIGARVAFFGSAHVVA
jgi:hypothetical protein